MDQIATFDDAKKSRGELLQRFIYANSCVPITVPNNATWMKFLRHMAIHTHNFDAHISLDVNRFVIQYFK